MRRICLIMAAALFLAGFNVLADARQHFLAGQDYYSQGRYEKSIEEFEEAYRLDPRPLLLYNIAQAHEKLGRLVKAVDYLKRYLEADPDSDERTTLLSKVANLEARIANTGIKMTANEVEATVYVDGKEVGKTPISAVIPLDVGAHKVQVSKQGFEDFKMNVAISSGQTTPVDVVLEPGMAGPAPAVVSEDGKGEGEAEGEGEEEDDGKKIEALDVVPWVVAGVGVIGAGVGWGVLGSLAKSAQPSESLKDTDYAKYKKEQDDAHSKAIVADVVGAVGAAIAVGGAVWGIMRLTKKGGDESEELPADGETEPEVAVVPYFGGGSGGVVATVQF